MLNYILNIVESLLENSSELSQKEKQLVYDQTSFALTQTKDHIASTRINSTDKSNSVLANIWLRTSNNLVSVRNRHVQELVEVMREKGKYWSDPESYDTRQFDEYNMRISQVELTLKNLCH